MDFFGNFFLVQKFVVASPEYVVAREGPVFEGRERKVRLAAFKKKIFLLKSIHMIFFFLVFEGRERKVRLAAFTGHIKPRLSANGRVPCHSCV